MGNESFADAIVDACENRSRHTPAPRGYIEWHIWAEEMSKTHDQKVCDGCGLLVIWVQKTAVSSEASA